MAVKHVFVSPKADSGDSTLVRPSNWNADHTGGAQSVRGTVDFGFSTGGEGDTATVTVSATWVTANSNIVCGISGIATSDHDAEDGLLEDITAMATNIVVGTSFDIEAYAPCGTWGQYIVIAVGE